MDDVLPKKPLIPRTLVDLFLTMVLIGPITYLVNRCVSTLKTPWWTHFILFVLILAPVWRCVENRFFPRIFNFLESRNLVKKKEGEYAHVSSGEFIFATAILILLFFWWIMVRK